VEWARESFRVPVLYTPGNHEHYGGSLDLTVRAMRDAAEGSNVRVLEQDVAIVDGVRFIGATLWTDFRLAGAQPFAELDAVQQMKDYRW